MKKQSGITLISLVITIILVIVLASVSIYTGIDIYENMREEVFIGKMRTIQEAVDKLCNEHTVQEINTMGQDFSSAPSGAKAVLNSVIELGSSGMLTSWFPSAGDNGTVNYRYFSTDDINTVLKLKDIDTPIFLNPKTRNVIAVEGVKAEGRMFNRQYDLSGGQQLPTPNYDTDLVLNVVVKTFDDKATISVVTDKTVTELRYQKKEGATYGNALISKDLNEVTITESGTYRLIAKTTSPYGQGEVEKTSVDQTIAIVNKPVLVDGMTPIIVNSASNYTEITANDILTKTGNYKNWYNYGIKKWANAKLNDGSVYVWIPRYAYSIVEGEVKIEFMQGNSSLMTTAGKALSTSYNIIPAFKDGSTTGYTNGEWDSEIEGIWVAKFETTAQTFNSKSYPANRYASESWRTISPENAFKICREMESLNTTNYFGSSVPKASGTLTYGKFATDTNNIDTHMMKNSEYAAVAYLTYSNYGNKDVYPADSYLSSATNNGFSTTGNATGIFGMAGGSREMVAAGRNIGPTVGDVAGPNLNSENKSTKYATYYPASILSSSLITADAIKDTDAFNSSNKTYCTTLFSRTGWLNTGGLFAYEDKDAAPDNTATFRPVLIVEY